MSHDDGSIHAAANELYDEHRGLAALLRRLGRAGDRATLAAGLDELHAALRAHFAHEEHPGGLYERLGALGPEHQAAVRGLVGDHFEMLCAVRGMATRVRHDDEPVAVFLAEITKLMTWIEDHEVREHTLAKAASRSE
jgi:hypothetical protein